MALKFLNEADLKSKRVLARFDFNVPLDKEDPTVITDTSRIDQALETIQYILDQGASKLVLMSHLGRPKGEVNPQYSLLPVATYLAEKLNEEVILTESCIENGIDKLLTLKSTKIVLLENLRFHKEETLDDSNFAGALSKYGDVYVNDAFGALHRKHASVHSINKFYKNKAYAGFLIQKEVEALDNILNSPKKPFVAIIGGAKVSDKIKTIERLLVNVDKLLIGGAMAYPFLKSLGHEIGNSLTSPDDEKLAARILKSDIGKKIELPVDHIISTSMDSSPSSNTSVDIKEGFIGLDIGEATINKYSNILKEAHTILWNGPMGYFENKDFSKGTFKLAEIIAETDSFSLVGGGDSVSAVKKSGYQDKFSHISTGGGASLEYIEAGTLPGLHVLKFGLE